MVSYVFKYLFPMVLLFSFFRFGNYKFLSMNIFFLLVAVFVPVVVSPVVCDGLMMVDELSSSMILLTFWVSGLMLMASDKLLSSSESSFVGWVVALCLILVLAFSSSSLIMFYIFFEFSLIPITIMVLGWGYQPERLQASSYLVLYTVGASLPLLVSVFMIFQSNGHVSFNLVMWYEPFYYNLMMWWVFSVFAFMVKTPLYFVHLWLPKAHVEAPVAGSMILAGLLLKLGGFGMLRLTLFYQTANMAFSCFLSSVAIWGGFLCGLICLRQTDMKSLIAYSSVTHMGVMVGGIMSNTVWGWQSVLLMMIAHGLVSSGMFAGANLLYQMFSSRSLFFVKGVMSVIPVMSLLWFLCLSANMGVPPTINLQSELMLSGSILFMSYGFILPVCLSLFFSAAYSLLLYSGSQMGSVGELSNVLSVLSSRGAVMLLLHLIPVFLLFMKSELVMGWVW